MRATSPSYSGSPFGSYAAVTSSAVGTCLSGNASRMNCVFQTSTCDEGPPLVSCHASFLIGFIVFAAVHGARGGGRCFAGGGVCTESIRFFHEVHELSKKIRRSCNRPDAMLKLWLVCLWSMNGILDKQLLDNVPPSAYASTKALAVSFGYILTQQPIEMRMLARPVAWLIVLVSILNGQLYARLIRSENPATAIPVVAAASHALRLVNHSVFYGTQPTLRQIVGIALAIVSGYLTST